MPPLLLDDEEAVAIAVGLRAASTYGIAGIEESSVRALAKLEQVLPARLRRRVTALHAATTPLDVGEAPPVDPDLLSALATASRDHERIRFAYRRPNGEESRRSVEPYGLVSWRRKWYLVGWDAGRTDWRVFRADRMDAVHRTGVRTAPRELPAADAAAFVGQALVNQPHRYEAVVVVHAPAETLAERIYAAEETLEPVDERTCRLRTAADSLDWLALRLGLLGADFEVREPPELAAHVRTLGGRFLRA
jgi:predicted DNA-binding transcriptional regulator YafY